MDAEPDRTDGAEDAVDRYGWRSFLLAFLTLVTGSFLTVGALIFAVPAALYAWKATQLSRESGVPLNAWGRIGQVGSVLVLVWVVAGSVVELT